MRQDQTKVSEAISRSGAALLSTTRLAIVHHLEYPVDDGHFWTILTANYSFDMSTSSDLPIYETKFVTVPVVTPVMPRRRSLPGRVGPWPLRRSRSEADQSRPPPTPIFGDPFEESPKKPNLMEVLKKIDEECATIETLVSKEKGAPAICEVEKTLGVEDREQGQPTRIGIGRRRANFLLALSTLALFVVFVWPPMMTFVFAKKDWGNILLTEGAPSVTVFVVLLAVPITLIRMGLSISILTIGELKCKKTLRRQRLDAPGRALLGLTFSIVVDVWIWVWLLLLMEHE